MVAAESAVAARRPIATNKAAASEAADDKPCALELTSGGRRFPPLFLCAYRRRGSAVPLPQRFAESAEGEAKLRSLSQNARSFSKEVN